MAVPLHEGRRVYCSAMVGTSPLWPNLAKQTGIDFVFVDTEHTPLDRQTLSWICQTYTRPWACRRSCGFRATIRSRRARCSTPGRAASSGRTSKRPSRSRALVGAVKLRPLKGRRLQRRCATATRWSRSCASYLEKRNGDKILIANIESVPAIENLHEICSVAGLDAVLIGPHDLSCSLGIPEQYDHPRFDEAVQTIFRIAREHKVGAGIHFWLGLDQEIAWAKAGGNLVMHSSDLAPFSRTLKSEIEHLRKALP